MTATRRKFLEFLEFLCFLNFLLGCGVLLILIKLAFCRALYMS